MGVARRAGPLTTPAVGRRSGPPRGTAQSGTRRLQGERVRVAPRGGAARVRDLHDGGPDVLFGGKKNVIEGIFEKLKAVESELIAKAG